MSLQKRCHQLLKELGPCVSLLEILLGQRHLDSVLHRGVELGTEVLLKLCDLLLE